MVDQVDDKPKPETDAAEGANVTAETATGPPAFYRSGFSRFRRIILISLIGFLVLRIDLFGVNQATSAASEQAIYQVFAPFYGERKINWFFEPILDPEAEPESRPSPIKKWQTDITVVLMEDSALRKHNLQWPISLEKHIEILEDIYEIYQPNALVIDFLFIDRREQDKEALLRFRDFLARIHDNEETITKVYLGAFNKPPHKTGILPELRDAADLLALSWHPPNHGLDSSGYYPMANSGGDRDSIPLGLDDGDSGPAFDIYRDLCAAATEAGKATMRCPVSEMFDTGFGSPMSTFWGVDGPWLNWEQSNRGSHFNCRAVSRSVASRAIALIQSGFFANSPEFPQDCPYVQMVLARDLLDYDFRVYPEVIEAYQAAMGGGSPDRPKVVFYGADLNGIPDKISTYTHGTVAGVYGHAMALDNLMTFGSEYIKYSTHIQNYIDVVMILLASALAVFVTDLRQIWIRWQYRQHESACYAEISGLLINFVLFSMIALFVLSVSLGIFLWLDLAPANWLGYLGVAAVGRIMEANAIETMAYANKNGT